MIATIGLNSSDLSAKRSRDIIIEKLEVLKNYRVKYSTCKCQS